MVNQGNRKALPCGITAFHNTPWPSYYVNRQCSDDVKLHAITNAAIQHSTPDAYQGRFSQYIRSLGIMQGRWIQSCCDHLRLLNSSNTTIDPYLVREKVASGPVEA